MENNPREMSYEALKCKELDAGKKEAAAHGA